jgi:hypothetical protein
MDPTKEEWCASNFVQPSCPRLSLVKSAGFTVITLWQSNIPPKEKSKINRTKRGKTDEEQSQEHTHHLL